MKVLFCLFLLTAVGYYVVIARNYFEGTHASQSVLPEDLERAAQLAPDDASVWNRLGKYQLLTGQPAQLIVTSQRRATELNPYSARYWLDLAVAYGISGDAEKQSEAVERALRADSTAPDLLWEAANIYLARGDLDQSAHLLRQVVDHEPSRLQESLQLYWRATRQLSRVEADLLRNDPRAFTAAIRYFGDTGQIDVAQELWPKLVALHKPVVAAALLPYVDVLLQHNRPDDAFSVWRSLPELDGSMKAYQRVGNNDVVNAGFELQPLAGFDWQLEQRPSVDVRIVSDEHHSGRQSVQITFPGEPVPVIALREYVSVSPNTTYEFEGYVKVDNLLSNSGLRYYVMDGYTSGPLLLTDDAIGTEDWKRLTGRFTTGPQTKLVFVGIGRKPADSSIHGRAWVDDVSLRKVQ